MSVRNEIFSPLSLYHFDNTIFEYFKVPDGMNVQTAIDAILVETAEISTIYTAPNTFRYAVKLWTNKNFMVWEKLWTTCNFEYNPIWNYDRTEEGTDTNVGKNQDTRNFSNVTDFTRNLSEKDDTDRSETVNTENDYNSSSTENVNNKVAAFNNGLTDSTTSTTIGSQSGHNDGDIDTTISDNRSISQTGTTKTTNSDTGTLTMDRDNTATHDFRAYGNIGVTTTQQMIEQEREVDKFNIYDYIVNDFKQNFCVMSY